MTTVDSKPRRGGRLPSVILVVLTIIAVLAVAVLIAITLLRPRMPTPTDLTRDAKAQLALQGGAQVFATHCAACHEHHIGPALGGMGIAPAAVVQMVRLGPGAMPAFPPSQVSDADLGGVADYVSKLPSTEKPK